MNRQGRILLTGRDGQVGSELHRRLGDRAEVVALGRAELDLADVVALRRAIRDVHPSIVINAAAYTAVDRAETEEELARAVNSIAPGVLAEETRRIGALLIHYSTDYVFDGQSRRPYREDDATGPLNAYGRTKLAGEQAIRQVDGRHLILRCSWVYGPRGSNFLQTVLRLARERQELRIVADQFGAPTSSLAIARATLRLAGQDGSPSGIYHLSAAGSTSWHGFASAVLEEAGMAAVRVVPITTAEYPTPTRRPPYSVLSNDKLQRTFGIALPQWRTGLGEVVRMTAG